MNTHLASDTLTQDGKVIKTAVIGASGFIGGHLYRSYQAAHPDTVGTTFSGSQPGLIHMDIREPAVERLRLEESGHRAVLIASAKPNIDFCEREREAAYAVNVRGTLELIRQISRTTMKVIFLSSDYVFDGRTGQYDDLAAVGPTTEYGRQKALVEKELPSLSDNFLILRLSKIFGLSKGDRTLLDEMAGALASGRRVRVARDQIFCPTFVGDLVRAIQTVQSLDLKGVLNVCSPESCSRFGVAQALTRAMGSDAELVEPIGLHEIPDMAGRPLNTSMRCSRLNHEVGFTFGAFQSYVDAVAKKWVTPRPQS